MFNRFSGNRRGAVILFFCLLVIAVYLFAVVPGPGIALPWMEVDDGLFLRWSISIRKGSWLGPWDYLTTSKGPLHSYLVGLLSHFGINPFAYKRLFLLIAALIFVPCVINARRPWLRLLLLIALLTDPFQYGAGGLRNLREGTYLPIQLITLGLGSRSLDQLAQATPLRASFVLPALGMAFGFGLLLITREGRVIVWAELLVWIGLAIWMLMRNFKERQLSSRALLGLGLAFFLAFTLLQMPMAILRHQQQSYYGYPLANSMEEGGFSRFYGKLSKLRLRGDDQYIPRVPIKKKTILTAIQELPDTQLGLRRILLGIDWKSDYGCRTYPDTCQDMASGWLQWSLRKSIATMISPDANEYIFQKVISNSERELEALCGQSERFVCDSSASGFLLKPDRWGFKDLPQAIYRELSGVAFLTFIPNPFPFGHPDLSRSTFLSILPKSDLEAIGIRVIPKIQQLTWQRFYVALSLLGTLLRWTFLIAALLALFLSAIRRKVLCGFDPVAIWLLCCTLIHVALYSLLGLISFPGLPYTVLAAPIAVGFYARLVDTLGFFVKRPINSLFSRSRIQP
jgi:hypothetical protein